jgi:predicted metalloprotease with PDZ domain
MVKTYTFDDVVNTLNQVVPYDWRGFWTDRLTNHRQDAPLGGIENSGWKLVYDEDRSEMMRAREDAHREINAQFSIGLVVDVSCLRPRSDGDCDYDGTIEDTVEGMDAARAGIGPGMTIIAVNGRRLTPEVFRDALTQAKNSSQPLQLLIENTDYFRTFNLDYHGGEKYPHLVRDESKPDRLSEIIKAR